MQNHIGIQAGMSLSRLGRLCRGLSSYMYGSLCVSFGHITLEINTSLVVRSAERSDASAARGAAVVCGSASGRWAGPAHAHLCTLHLIKLHPLTLSGVPLLSRLACLGTSGTLDVGCCC